MCRKRVHLDTRRAHDDNNIEFVRIWCSFNPVEMHRRICTTIFTTTITREVLPNCYDEMHERVIVNKLEYLNRYDKKKHE